jgi:hypothetical protein
MRSSSYGGELLTASLTEIGNRNRSPKERAEFVSRFLQLADERMAAEKYELTGPVIKVAAAAVAKVADNELKKEVRYREQEIQEYRSLFAAMESARETLAQAPQDAEANLALGQYLAIARHDWERALPHLAKGSDAAVSDTAQLETKNAADPARAADTAAAWIEAADKAPVAAKAVYFEHARQLFAQAAASTKGTASAKMLARFKKVEGDVFRTAGSAFVQRHPLEATAYGGHWYQFIAKPADWQTAERLCRQRGGHLVCVETAAENQWLKQFAASHVKTLTNFRVWIGATSEGHGRTFTWINGSPFQFTDWRAGRPMNATIEQAVNLGIAHGEPSMQWWDMGPSAEFPFICEWDR